MEANMDTPGPVEIDTVVSADWAVPLSGLLNLDAPEAKQAQLKDHDEPIQIYAHVVHHPRHGIFLVDTGVSQQLLADPGRFGVHWLMRKFMPLDQIQIRHSTGEIVEHLAEPLRGVFFTHLHIDHISGMPDVPATVPLYVGKGEATTRSFSNAFVNNATNALLDGKAALHEWEFAGPADQPLSGVIDVFGDGTLYAFNVPGHTPGSTAYLARTPKGPILLTGDTCHTAWGWTHSVEPGSYTADGPLNRRSLLALRALAERHPGLQVRLGHQAS
jgi:glyoxylase-like metal-dependent hydrolase (beta-lactamase superfamily II)